jgi:aspartyl/asparaginyl-tRNA synthetase
MWLEYELLNNPDAVGFFYLSTSFRSEPNPIPGRHKTIFPMFEFEQKGEFKDLKKMEKELVDFLGIQKKETILEKDYREISKKYGVDEIENEHEAAMREEYGSAVLLTHFPLSTSPFWNMKTEGDIAQKIDVIIEGQETIGSAERSTDKKKMYDLFHTISDGQYAQLLYDKFGKERIDHELSRFLSFDFFPRFGGGIGVNRLARALKIYKII